MEREVFGFVLLTGLAGCGSGTDVLYVGSALSPDAAEAQTISTAMPEAAPVSEASTSEEASVEATASEPLPPLTWQEHWYEHIQLLDLTDHDDLVAIYFDHDVDRTKTTWIFPFVSRMWQYTVTTYGPMGGRLYAIFHQGKYEGCHMDNHFSSDHDNRNVIDCGFDGWEDPPQSEPFLESHMASLVVEFTSRGKNTSPLYKLWGDGNWAEFYQYDLYRALGMTAEAQSMHDAWVDPSHYDDFPRRQTHWFRDWFYPLWKDHGGADVMSRFFVLLSSYYPTSDGIDYLHTLNWGEYVHFTSGAAQMDLRPLATNAFGWPTEWEAQYQRAKTDFPQIVY